MNRMFYLTKACLCGMLLLTLAQCKKEKVEMQTERIISDKNSNKAMALPGAGGGVLMQAFYWDVPAGGTWYNTVSSKIAAWNSAGISAIWLPPPSKAMNGGSSMGYDPFDYFDLGQYNQMGSIETRFGSNTELSSLITNAHNNNIQVYADIVLNHNSGGAGEANPRTGGTTYTKFNGLSGKFPRTYDDFHPSSTHANDEGSFGGFPDLCHHQANVSQWLWVRTDAYSKYLKNTMKFDGWRFDFVKGFGPWVVKDFTNSIGGFAVGENWDADVNVVKGWVDGTGRVSSAFDFPCYYKMDDAFDNNNLNKLNDDMLWKRDAAKAVTFVTNHDTDIIWDKMLAYAYILTHEGYPTIFYRDYEEWLDKAKLNNLIWIHKTLAVGTTTNLYTDTDEYIAKRNGTPGLIVYLNDSDFWQEKWVTANWANAQIKDYTGGSTWMPTTAADSRVLIKAPPHSYTVWSKVGY